MEKKIMMVCHGNICRSPLARVLLAKHLHEKKVTDIEVDSSGTSDAHAGQQPDHRTMANATKHGIDLTAHRAKQFKLSDFAKFDRIYVMDSANYADIMLLGESTEDENKVKLFLDAAHPGSNDSVPDPWYGSEDGFEKVFHIIDKACNALASEIKNGKLP